AAQVIQRKTREKARRDHYPAPFALIDLWREHGGSKSDMLAGERESVARLITGDTAQNLIRVFFLRERLKKAGRESEREIEHVHVIGAGVMGGDIAAWCALKGLRVSLSDIDVDQIGAAVGRADSLFRKKLRERNKVRDAHDRLLPDPSGKAVRRADLVIEAVAEKLDVKKAVFAEVIKQARDDALLATNTSAIPLEDIAEAVGASERLMGLHFFNPVAKLPLVEVVRAEGTAEETAAAGAAFCEAIGKLPLPVKSAPGFLVNRVLTPYMLEAMKLIEEGHAPETVDRAAEEFGMPMGPVELADSVGLDIAREVGERLAEHFSLEAPDRLQQLVRQKKLGKKSGEGFYVWKDGKPQKNEKSAAEPEKTMVDRLILQMVNACAGCLRDGVVEDADMADAGMIFGTGFAPFRGGPMHYVERRGRDDVVGALENLAEQHGKRFQPDRFWAKTKKKTKTKGR
ncbi:MAG: 3-hydroxyacyl-CoA dehydrogenase NAD-binding domain-containing protein, partial [Rhodovibrionaceae bacterium]|nr:3-hydroxyacyl-CoA dehydrogenase NAD-binding domain-containing protein [Rhodovibrionaceae bacterium]